MSSGSRAAIKARNISSSAAVPSASGYRALSAMKRSNTSVHSTTVRGMVTHTPSMSSNCGLRFIIESMNARPRPLPPMLPSPMRAKLL